MRSFRPRRGPFDQQPYYREGEIDRICADALKSVDLLPEAPEAIRVDRFVERYFKVPPSYEALPDGVLGYTKFGPEGVKEIVVTTMLDEQGGLVNERRVRTTLAHESGHGLLHAHLFADGTKPTTLFNDDNDRPEILCRDDHEAGHTGGYDGRWWEFQANQAIAGLLLPRQLVLIAVEPFCESTGLLGLAVLAGPNRERAARKLAGIFDVNPVVIRRRLDDLFPRSEDAQLSL